MKIQITTILFVLVLILINYQVESSLLKKKTSNLNKVEANSQTKLYTNTETHAAVSTTKTSQEKKNHGKW